MSSTLVLIALLASLSMAVILPEMQISKNNTSFNAKVILRREFQKSES